MQKRTRLLRALRSRSRQSFVALNASQPSLPESRARTKETTFSTACLPRRQKMLLNVSPEELVALKAAMEIALKAASGYSVRTCPERDVIGEHWKEFTRLHSRIKALEQRREFHMTKGQIREGRKYIHVAIDEGVHDKLY